MSESSSKVLLLSLLLLLSCVLSAYHLLLRSSTRTQCLFCFICFARGTVSVHPIYEHGMNRELPS